jgi:hypothetical protein
MVRTRNFVTKPQPSGLYFTFQSRLFPWSHRLRSEQDRRWAVPEVLAGTPCSALSNELEFLLTNGTIENSRFVHMSHQRSGKLRKCSSCFNPKSKI